MEYNPGNCNGGWQRQAASFLRLFSLVSAFQPPLLWASELPIPEHARVRKEDSMRQQKRTFCLGLMALIVWLMAVTSSVGAPPQQTGAGEKNQPVALPAAKEELLGELSPQTDVPGPEITKRPWKEFLTTGWTTPKPEADYSFDPASLRFAARAKQGQKWVLIVDGKEQRTFDGVESVLVSPLGQHAVYSAKRDNKWVKMMDDKELGSAFDKLGGGFWLFGDARLDHYAYPAKRGDKWLIVADGKEGPEFKELGHPYFSRNGQRLVYPASPGKNKWVMVVDGNKGPEFEEVSPPVFSPGGERLAYRGKRNKDREVLVLDGKETTEFEYGSRLVDPRAGWGSKKEFDHAGQPVFSPDGRHWVYRVKHDEKRQAVIVDGKEGPNFEEVGRPFFSPDGQHLAYWAKRDEKRDLFVLDGKEGPEFEEVARPAFSPDGRRFAYLAKRGKLWRMVIDGQDGSEFEHDIFGYPKFSPDSQHVIHLAMKNHPTWNQSNLEVLELRDGKIAETATTQFHTVRITYPFMEGESLSPDGQRTACVVAVGGQAFFRGQTTRALRRVIVDGQVGKDLDALDIDLMFSPDSRHFVYAVRGGVGDNKSMVVLDGQEGKLYDDVIGGGFPEKREGSGPSSTALVYIAREGRKFYRVTQPLP